MATSYTSLLGFALPVTGELAGLWGDTVNDYITKYVDAAVAGAQTISGSQTAVTLSITNGATLTQVGSGSTGSAQYAIINCTGNPAGLLTITAPASSKTYLVINATSTSQSVKIVGAGPTTGVTIVAGEKALVSWNGSDFVRVSTAGGPGVFSSITDSGLTAGRVTYATTSGLLTDSANLTFDGTTLSTTTLDATNLEVTNIKAKDGTAAMSIADSTGAVTVSSAFTANGGAVFNENGADVDFRVEGDTDANLFFVDASTDRVGIGTSSPTQKLDVNGIIRAYQTTSSAQVLAGNTGGVIIIARDSSTGSNFGSAYSANIYCDGAYPLLFWTDNAERLRITSGGKVNIGGNFTSTNNTLQVTGNAAIGYTTAAPTTGLIVAGNVGIGTDNPAGKLTLAGYTSANNDAEFQLTRTSSSTGIGQGPGIRFNDGTTNNVRIIQNGSGNLQFWHYNGSWQTEMTLDTSGNLGLGVTPSAWSTGYYLAQQIGGGGSFIAAARDTSNELTLGTNAYFDGTNWKRTVANYATLYKASSGAHSWWNAASSTAGSTISFTQAMTLDASGNLGVGITLPTSRLHLKGPAGSNPNTNGVVFQYSGSTANFGAIGLDNSTGDLVVASGSGAALRFYTNSDLATTNERARITSGGQFAMTNDGTNAAPAISFTNDLDTGIFRPTTNQLGFVTAGVQAMTLDASGNLGIANTSPGVSLEIGSNTSTVRALAVRYSSVPAYLSNSYDGSVGLTTLSCNSYNTSSGSATWSSFANSAYSNSAIQLATGTGGADIRFLTAAAANTNPTERARITSGGNLDLQKNIGLGGASATTSGTGITFPATDSASSNANTLDDYEEGTFDPEVTFGGGSTGITYTTKTGFYRKIGSLVFFSFRIILSSKGSSTGNVKISIPFPAANISRPGGANLMYGTNFTTVTAAETTIDADQNTSVAALYTIAAGSSLSDSNFQNTTDFIAAFCYISA